MAKQIVILDRQDGPVIVVTVAYWLTVDALRQPYYARAGAKSAWVGASQAENDAIAAGQVVEVVDQATMQPGANLSQMQADLVTRFGAKQADFTASVAPSRYGSFYDGTVWTMVNI